MAHAYQTSYHCYAHAHALHCYSDYSSHCKVWLNTCQYCDRTPACQTSNQTCSDLGSKRGFPTTPISKVCHFSVGQNALWDGRTCPPGSCDAMRLCEEWLGWMGSSVCRPRPSQGAWILTNSGWYPRSGFWKFSWKIWMFSRAYTDLGWREPLTSAEVITTDSERPTSVRSSASASAWFRT